MAQSNGKTPFVRVGADSLWANIFSGRNRQQEDVLTTLSKTPLFADMKYAELREFQKIIHQRRFNADEPIFWEGEPGVGMYIVNRGSVTICRVLPDKEREEMAVLRNGEFFGELALLDESPRSASCIARENCEIIGLFRPDLFGLLERKPRLGNKFLFQLATVIGERLKAKNKEVHGLKAKLDASDIII